MKRAFTVAVVGQPNVGKSHLLNALSGAHLKVGNFAGVTVEKAEALLRFEEMEVRLIDLPGLYSLDEFSKDEEVAKKFLLEENYDMILNVVDSTNLERNLYLTTELMALNKKMVLALNMDDEAQKEGIHIDEHRLGELLGLPVVKVSSTHKSNFPKMIELIRSCLLFPPQSNKLLFGNEIEREIGALHGYLNQIGFVHPSIDNRQAAILLLRQDKTFYKAVHDNPKMLQIRPYLEGLLDDLFSKFNERNIDEIFLHEYHAFARGAAVEVTEKGITPARTLTEKIDAILIHKLFGLPIFLLLMWLLFQATFTLGEVPMAYIEAGFGWLGETLGASITDKEIRSVIVDGIIAGVGTVILFLPNIVILFLSIALLETTGYMARVSFLLDGFFHKFGLHGKSFIPLVTGFGCSIPAYMAARTLKSEKDRLLTMFIIGFMSCGARLPVYVLFAGAFFAPEQAGNVLFVIYISGAALGLIAARILSLTVFKGTDEPFVMEMPKYRLPSPRLIWFAVYSKALMYLKKAGTFILAASILVWIVSTYPKSPEIGEHYAPLIDAAVTEEAKTQLANEQAQMEMEKTYLGLFGKTIEPLFAPLGFDWRMSVATISGLAAKEVIVSTLGVLYALGGEVAEDDASLQERLAHAIPLPAGIAFIVFVMVYLPCLAATAVFSREAGRRIYTVYLVLFTFATAWILAFAAYHLLTLLGF